MNQERSDDEKWMGLALNWGRKGLGSTYPNPCVGAVVVKDGEVVGQAHSGATGKPHAERQAIAQAGDKAQGATLYVTLEPCAHTGRTPPCTEAILEAKMARVVYGIVDPAPNVAGRGLAILREAGVDVEQCLEDKARRLHAHYLWHVEHGRPFVTLKAALSMDGQMACASGHSKWITGPAARQRGHRLRARHHAILVGRGTVEEDDPRLNVRFVQGEDPRVVVLDSRLRLGDGDYQVWRPGTMVYTLPDPDPKRVARLEDRGVQVIEVATVADGGLDLQAVLDDLGARQIRSLLVEGGGEVLGSFMRARCWNVGYFYMAPRLLGRGRSLMGQWSAGTVEEGPALQVRRVRRVGRDLELRVRPENAPPIESEASLEK